MKRTATLMRPRKSIILVTAILLVGSTALPAMGQSAALDLSFDPGSGPTGGTSPIIYAAAQKPNGKIVIGGVFNTYNGSARNFLAHVDTNGTLDPAFGQTGPNGPVHKVVMLSDGRMLIGGAFSNFGGINRNSLARILPDGSLDFTFISNVNTGNVQDMAVQPDGNTILVGTFTSFQGQVCNRVVRVDPDGWRDGSFNIGSGAQGTSTTAINAVVLQPDGKVIIGGSFTSYNGTDIKHIARLNTDGSLDNSFNPGTGAGHSAFAISPVHAIALQPDGRIIIAGQFNLYNDVSRPGIARLNPNGSLDTSFDPGTGLDGVGYSLLLRENGKCLVGGSFLEYDGVDRRGLALIHADGTLDAAFDPGNGATPIRVVAPHSEGKILVGGGFTQYNDTSRVRIARLMGDALATHVSATANAPLPEVFPVPARDILHIRLPGPAFARGAWLTMIDATGRTVRRERLSEGLNQVHVGGSAPGIHHFMLQDDHGGLHSGTLVIE